MSTVKLNYDVSFKQMIQQVVSYSQASSLLLAIPIKDGEETYDTFGTLDDVAEKFDESSDAYKLASKYFETLAKEKITDQPISIGQYLDKKQDDPMGVVSAPVIKSVTATADGATISSEAGSVTQVSGSVHFLTNYFKAGWRYVILPEADTEELESVMDFLYENQDGILVLTASDVASATELEAYAKSDKFDSSRMLPVIGLADKDGQPLGAGAVAQAVATLPIDWQRIGNIPGIKANSWTSPEITQLSNLNFIPVVNKGGDMMLLHGRALDGHYVDNMFGAQYIYDYMIVGLQNWLDLPEQRHFKFNDSNLSKLKAQAQTLLNDLGNMGFFAEGADGKPVASVDIPSRNQVTSKQVEARTTAMTIGYTMANLLDSVDGQINVTI
ncbi:hypothetical protein FD13_GL000306 [Levilactobacillus senmaizukei DSM 21775 = NBRC 103853]|uniref:Uncharacterized protein n=1 Tax=Levilactobacillus senmaizukei DSM 21775 = NBRC 103853 TaxID=1423803 RepID=A0A0R2DF15_9LACO|nr:hypothetical protein [Levilactobacillus senmaizukei]KRN02166.1 hypothetical protein FD13_GL000306 [Levilactobacillus senmaizukei DSM 21775 = NBRC 103853]